MIWSPPLDLVTCKSCGKPKSAKMPLPHRVSGYVIPQLCMSCLLTRADRMERERRRYEHGYAERVRELETK